MDDLESACLDVDEMERFAGLAKDALTPTQRARIEFHIDRCAWCRRGISELVRSSDAQDDFC